MIQQIYFPKNGYESSSNGIYIFILLLVILSIGLRFYLPSKIKGVQTELDEDVETPVATTVGSGNLLQALGLST